MGRILRRYWRGATGCGSGTRGQTSPQVEPAAVNGREFPTLRAERVQSGQQAKAADRIPRSGARYRGVCERECKPPFLAANPLQVGVFPRGWRRGWRRLMRVTMVGGEHAGGRLFPLTRRDQGFESLSETRASACHVIHPGGVGLVISRRTIRIRAGSRNRGQEMRSPVRDRKWRVRVGSEYERVLRLRSLGSGAGAFGRENGLQNRARSPDPWIVGSDPG